MAGYESPRTTKHLSVRVSASLMRKIDAYAAQMQESRLGSRVPRGKALREILILGLEQLEKERITGRSVVTASEKKLPA